MWLCWPGGVSNRTVARSAARSPSRRGRTTRVTVSSLPLAAAGISSIVSGLGSPQTGGARILSRLALAPLVVGLSYETIRLASESPNPLLKLLLRPNLQLQAMTTRNPDEGQMDVAIAAVRAAVALHQQA